MSNHALDPRDNLGPILAVIFLTSIIVGVIVGA